MAGDGQVTMGQTVVKGNARKVRRIGDGQVLTGFAGATADAFTLLERLEAKLERFPNQLERACVELAKDWRTDRYLRRLEAMMAVADADPTATPSPAMATCWNPKTASSPSAPAAITRWPPPARWSPWKGSAPRRSRAAPWASPPISASTPTTPC